MGKAAKNKRQRAARELPITRACDPCQACCFTVSVYPDGVDKEPLTRAYETCPHQCPTGCAIYATRPKPCRTYRCMWHLGWGAESDRPDLLGLVVEVFQEGVAIVNETRPEARNEERAGHRLAVIRSKVELVVILTYGRKGYVMFDPPPYSAEKLRAVSAMIGKRLGVLT